MELCPSNSFNIFVMTKAGPVGPVGCDLMGLLSKRNLQKQRLTPLVVCEAWKIGLWHVLIVKEFFIPRYWH